MKVQPVRPPFAPVSVLLPLLLAGTLLLLLTLGFRQSAVAQADRCFASLGNSTDFASEDAQAVRDAIAAAPANGIIKLAGDCRGAVDEGGTRQLALLTKTITLRGGYTPADWTESRPAFNPTTLDALRNGRVISTSHPLTVENLIIQNGLVTNSFGGGLYVASDLWLIGSQVSNNQATGVITTGNGGGVVVADMTTIIKSTFLSNTASGIGGGAALYGPTTITGTTFRDNHALFAYGGGVAVMHEAVITATAFLSNSAASGGGGAALLVGQLTQSTFQGNRVSLYGGGLAAGTLAALIGSRFQDNEAGNSGGALWVSGATLISTTSFISNTAQQAGGALSLMGETAAPMFVVNSLFARNRALAQQGDALYFYGQHDDSHLVFLQNTVANPTTNGAPAGVAVAVYTGTVSLFNTIIANYQVAISSTAVIHEGYNLYDNVTTRVQGTISDTFNSSTGASRFVDSANDDYHLLAGSDALDRGATGFLRHDLDGAPRPQGYATDIGAYEAAIAQGNCFASADSGITVRASGDSSALQQAIDDAIAMGSGGVRVAGRCAGVAVISTLRQVALISKTLTVAGGYAENNWTTSNPSAHPTTLDALQSGRVIVASQPVTLVNLIVQNGLMRDEPGGGILANSDLWLVGSQISNNVVLTTTPLSAFGGGAFIRGTATITRSRFHNNRASSGGGAALLGAATIMRSAFLSNTAQTAGGALYLFGDSTTPIQVINTLFARNRSQSQQSDVIYLFGFNSASRLDLLHNTLANPQQLPSSGTAIGVKAGNVSITNTIIAYHNLAISNSMGLVSEDYNLYEGVTTPFTGPVNAGVHSFSGVSSFADSATDDYHLLANSAAVDVGADAGIGDDFDGMPRPQGNGFDLGAFEWDTQLATVSIGDSSVIEGDSGVTTLTLPVNLSFANGLTVTVRYSTTAGSATDGVDYTGVTNGTLTFAPRVATQSIEIPILADTLLEGDESFTVTLGQPHFATIGDGSGQATIIDNEQAPTPTPTVTPPPSSQQLYLPVVKR